MSKKTFPKKIFLNGIHKDFNKGIHYIEDFSDRLRPVEHNDTPTPSEQAPLHTNSSLKNDDKGKPIQKKEPNIQKVSLYYYTLPDGNTLPQLINSPTTISGESNTAVMQKTIQKVIFLKKDEVKDILESFPIKYKLLSVSYDTENPLKIVLNFDKNFGENVSYDILKYQLKQFFYIVKQFPRVQSLQVKKDGKAVRYFGGDGIFIPRTITKDYFM